MNLRDMILFIFAFIFLFLHLMTILCIFILNSKKESEYHDPYEL
jgi:hypothetical protein